MRDVTRILSDAELIKLRALLAQSPVQTPLEEDEFKDYPKMLYAPEWVTCYRLIKDHPDPLIKKEAMEKLKHVQVQVFDAETEEEYLLDGWKRDPNDFIVEANIAAGMTNPDPRVPTGREARRASAMNKRDREAELRDIRLRYAELMGITIDEDPTLQGTAHVPAEAPPPPAPEPVQEARAPRPQPSATTKRQRVQQAASRASGRSVHA